MVRRKKSASFLSLILAGAMLISEIAIPLPAAAGEQPDNDIKYISTETYERLNEGTKQAYIGLCEEIDTLSLRGLSLENVVFATDKEGNLYESYTIPYNIVTETGSMYTEEVISEDISGNLYDASYNDIPDEEEETTPEETLPEPEEQVKEFISENMDFLETVEDDDPEVTVLGPTDGRDTLIEYIGKDYFTRNLSSLEMTVYSAAYKRLTKGKTSFSFTVPYGTDEDFVSLAIAKTVSIITTTYLNKFNNINFNAGIKVSSVYSNGKYTYKASLKKSSFYTDTLNTKANKKISAVVKEAYSYASTHYPEESFTYGIVEYLDDWLSSHVAENTLGLSTDPQVMAGKEYFYCHTVYGPLLYGYGVCEGYAKTLSQMLDAAGITNIYVVSSSHAFVYVMMNDDGWYIVDPMLNDAGASSSKDYLLTGAIADAAHAATGVIFKVNESDGYTLDYPDVTANDYAAFAEEFSLSKQVVAVALGKSTTLSVPNAYYKNYKKTWTSSNTKIATVSSSGKITSKAVGNTTVSCTIAGRSASCNTYIYQFTKLTFDNGKNTAKKTYVNTGDYVLNSKGIPTFEGSQTITLTVNQKNKKASAYELYLFDKSLNYPKVSSSNTQVARIDEVILSGDTISVSLVPLKIGTTTVTVKFGGQTAKLTYTVKQELKDEWFTAPSVSAYTYNGAAKKPKVYKDAEQTIYPLPIGLTTTTKYLNNINAGTATVSISGKGYYSGTVTRNFTINPIVLTAENTKLSVSSKKDYTGSALSPKITLTYKTLKLKKNKDFTVSYVFGSLRPDVPTESGTYTVVVNGKGNYTGSLPTKTLVVNKIDGAKLKLSASNVAWNNNYSVTPKIRLTYNDIEIPRETSVFPKKNYEIYYYKKTNEGTNTFSKDRLTSISARGTYKVVVVFTANNIDNTVVKELEKIITVY